MINRILKNPIYRKHRELLISLIDCAIVIFAYFCAFFIVSLNFRISAMAELTAFSLLKGLTLMLVIYMASFLLFRINRSMWKYTGPSEVMHIVTAVIMCDRAVRCCIRPLVDDPLRLEITHDRCQWSVRNFADVLMSVSLIVCCGKS